MICKYCSQTIPDGSLFCMFCGERLARKRREKKAAPRYPKPRTLADGSLLGQLMVEGERVTVKGTTEAEYHARIDGIRAGILERKAHPERRTLQSVLRAYIDKNDGVLSPATIRGYEIVYAHRFAAFMEQQIGRIDYQMMVNDEAKKAAPKTVRNGWALVSAAFNDAGLSVPRVNLPAVPPPDGEFLDFEQIQVFLQAAHGDKVECAALLALHSLRLSELLKLTADQISGGVIHVRGAIVQDKHNKMVEKDTNKNITSSRDVPVMIPRLLELIPPEGTVVTIAHTTIQRRIKEICTAAGLPPCSPHDLRRSFASLAKHLNWMPDTLMRVGGWSDMTTVNRIYAKLAEQDASADVEKMKNYYQITTDNKKTP